MSVRSDDRVGMFETPPPWPLRGLSLPMKGREKSQSTQSFFSVFEAPNSRIEART